MGVRAGEKVLIYTDTGQKLSIKVTDLKGKRVSTGAAGGGAEIIALRVLEAAGLDPAKDIRRERLSVAEGAAALKDRKVDAAFEGALGTPASAVMDLASTPGIKRKLIPTMMSWTRSVENTGLPISG